MSARSTRWLRRICAGWRRCVPKVAATALPRSFVTPASNMAFLQNTCVDRLAAVFLALVLWRLPCPAQQPSRTIVAISAGGGDYLKGAGGTLARFIEDG